MTLFAKHSFMVRFPDVYILYVGQLLKEIPIRDHKEQLQGW